MQPPVERAWTLLEQTRAGAALDRRWTEARAAFTDYGQAGVNAAWMMAFFAVQSLAQSQKHDENDMIALQPNPEITPEMARLFGTRARADEAWHEGWFLIAATASLGHPEGAQQHDVRHLSQTYSTRFKGGGIYVLTELAANAMAGLESVHPDLAAAAVMDLRQSMEELGADA